MDAEERGVDREQEDEQTYRVPLALVVDTHHQVPRREAQHHRCCWVEQRCRPRTRLPRYTDGEMFPGGCSRCRVPHANEAVGRVHHSPRKDGDGERGPRIPFQQQGVADELGDHTFAGRDGALHATSGAGGLMWEALARPGHAEVGVEEDEHGKGLVVGEAGVIVEVLANGQDVDEERLRLLVTLLCEKLHEARGCRPRPTW
mmetsp:Transcript_45888/g.127449  ORF Transcript_45888/g.127449 Transcript_45888/m.127449 type:complete len:202 (+) Transcript_45888:523-1128(+)